MIDFSGDWHSYYRYPSSSRGDDFWGQNLLHATQSGDKLKFETGPDSPSHIVIEVEKGTEAATFSGGWFEKTNPKGYYKGKRYDGTITLTVAENGERLNGIWHGLDSKGAMQSDIWELAKVKQLSRADNLPERWKLTHWYPGDDDKGEAFDEHEMKSYWHDDTLVLESLPKDDGSYMLARLHVQDGVATGNWYEQASLKGKYKGVQYSGAGQLIVDADTHRMEGSWAGAGYDHKINKMRVYTGRWEVVPADEA